MGIIHPGDPLPDACTQVGKFIATVLKNNSGIFSDPNQSGVKGKVISYSNKNLFVDFMKNTERIDVCNKDVSDTDGIKHKSKLRLRIKNPERFVQAQSKVLFHIAGISSDTISYSSNVTKDNLLVCCLAVFWGGAYSTASGPITDSQGNSWVQINGVFNSTAVNDSSMSVWMAIAGSTGPNTVTVNWNPVPPLQNAGSVIVGEYKTTNPSPLDSHSTNANSGGGPPTSTPANTGSIPVSGPGELLVGFFAEQAGQFGVLLPDAGFNFRVGTIDNDHGQSLYMLDKENVSGPASVNGTYNTGSIAYSAFGVSFK